MLSMMMLAVCLGQAADIAMERRASAEEKLYRVIDGKADAKTLNGFRRYHGGCNHCHGPNGEGSSFARSLVADLPTLDVFLQVVREGRKSGGNSAMDGFGDNPNFAPYLLDIYAYLQARADGVLGRGRPARLDP